MQTEHLAAASAELVPAGHSWHCSLTELSRNMPGVHGLQKLEPSDETW
jgi:hypothetical protein